jgi:hypothetical protein
MAENLEQQRKQLETLIKQYEELTRKKAPLFDVSNIKNTEAAINAIASAIEDAKDKAANLNNTFSDLQEEAQGILSEMIKTANASGLTTKAIKNTVDITKILKYDQEGISKLTLKELEKHKEKLKQQQSEAKFQSAILQKQYEEKGLNAENILRGKDGRLLNENALKARAVALKISVDQLRTDAAILAAQQAGFPVIENTNSELDKRIQKEEQINKLLGLGGAALHSIEHTMEHIGLGSLAHHLGIEEANEKMREMAEEIERAGGNVKSFSNKFEVLKTGLTSIGKSFTHHLTDPAVVMTALIGGLIHAFQHVDKEISQVAKDLGIGRDEAQSMVLEMEHMANHSNNVFINTEKLVKANTELNKLFGTAVVMNEEMLVSYTELTTQAGYSVEEASKLAQISVANGDSIKENTSAILGQVAALNAENGLAINTKDIMADISKISSATTLTLGNQPEKLASAAYKAKQFGMELSKLESISQGLLNFEESISAELEAELLTGKDLNLEKARQAALNGDLATVAEEIAKQTGTAAEFTKMNVIQQEALAKSVGMTRDDLAKSLMDREAMEKLAGKEGKTAQEKFNNLVKEVGLEEAKKQIGNEQLANQLASVSSQEKLAAAATKLQEIFASLVTPLMPVLDIFGSIFEVVGPIVGAVGTLVGYLGSALKYLIPIYGVYKGIQASQTASLVISRSASIIEAGKLTLLRQQLATEGELSLLDKITLGLAQAKLFVFNQQYRTKVLEATQTKIVSGLEKISLAIQEAYQAVKLRGLATTAKDIALQTALKVKQLGGFLVDVGKFAIKSAIAVAGIPIIGPVLAVGAIAAAIAGGMALYSKFKGDDVVSGGYGKRTLLAPEGAIALNDKDTVIAGTDLGGKNKSNTGGNTESPAPTSSPSIDISPLVERMSAVEGLLSQILQKETNIYMDSTKVGTGFAMSTSKIQ